MQSLAGENGCFQVLNKEELALVNGYNSVQMAS
jgi:hypothetical protein